MEAIRASWAWETAGVMLRTLATSLGAGLVVAGAGLLGLAISFFMEAVGVSALRLSASVGEALGAGLVLASVGWLFIGVAWENLLGYAPLDGAKDPARRTVAWLVAVPAVGGALAAAGWYGHRYGAVLWPGLPLGGAFLHATGMGGLIAPPPVILALSGLQRLSPSAGWVERARLPVLMMAWSAAALALFLPALPQP